jgi:hypothetical protein
LRILGMGFPKSPSCTSAPTLSQLRSYVAAASLAPSPDNNQPWLFEARPELTLLLYHDRTRALPSDVDDMFSMIALGAAMENLVVAARQDGWESQVQFHFEDDGSYGRNRRNELAIDKELIASLHFVQKAVPDPLCSYLASRTTNRKPYSREPLPETCLKAMENAASAFPDAIVHWVTDRAKIRALARLIAKTDRIRFEYEPFHTELFRQLRFSAQEAEATRDGLDIRTLEIPALGRWLLKWLRPWKRMRGLNCLGLSRLLTIPSALLAWRSGALGLLTTQDKSRQGYLCAGRAMERIWLQATKEGIGFHPLGSLPIFLSWIARKGERGLTAKHTGLLRSVRNRFYQIVPLATDLGLVILFRIGNPKETPSGFSLRRPTGELLISKKPLVF